MTHATEPHKILVIGGGAGGLELVTQLGHRYRKKPNINFWKKQKVKKNMGAMVRIRTMEKNRSCCMDCSDYQITFKKQI